MGAIGSQRPAPDLFILTHTALYPPALCWPKQATAIPRTTLKSLSVHCPVYTCLLGSPPSEEICTMLDPAAPCRSWAYVDSCLRQVDALGTQRDECQEDEEVEEFVAREDKRIGPGKEGRKGW